MGQLVILVVRPGSGRLQKKSLPVGAKCQGMTS